MSVQAERRELLMLDPRDRARLDTFSTEEIAADADARMRLGGVVPAIALYRIVLERNPRHATALREIAKVTEEVDQASALYRRAAAVDGLEPDDYLRWARLLLIATPSRRRQAIDAVRRMRVRFPDRPEALAKAAILLADADDLVGSEAIVSAMNESQDLPEDVAYWLVFVVKKLLDAGGPWKGRYWEKKPQIQRILRGKHHETLYEAARLAFNYSDLPYAKQLLEQIDGPPAESVTLLLAFIADADEKHEDVLRLVEAAPESKNVWLRLAYATALHSVGLVDAAAAELTQLVDESRRVPERTKDAEQTEENKSEDDTTLRDLRDLRVRALLSLAAVRYDRADFRGYWEAIRECAGIDPGELPAIVRAGIVVCTSVLDTGAGDSGLRELDRLIETPGPDHAEVRALELTRMEIQLLLAARSAPMRSRAEVAARETLSRLRKELPPIGTDGPRRKLAQAAYAALLVDDDDVARRLLDCVEVSRDSWRESTLRAIVSLRGSQPEKAVDLLSEVLKSRRHDLDRRCLFVQAELAASRIEAALRDAAAVVQFAPGHVTGRLLHAEALYIAAGEPGKDGAEDYPHLIRATREYAEVLRLHDGLTAFLSGRDSDLPIGSEQLPDPTLVHVARQCTISAVRATRALARAGLPLDRSVRDRGLAALRLLEDKDEAKRFRRMLTRPRSTRNRRQAARAGSLLLGITLVALAFVEKSLLTVLGSSPNLRLLVAAVGGVAIFWPYVRKFSVGGVEVERNQVVDSLSTSRDILPGSAVGAQQFFGRLLAPPVPPASMTADNVDTPADNSVKDGVKGEAYIAG